MAMSVTAPGATAAAAQNSSANTMSKNAVDYQTFLRLLVAEMKYQDPTSPMDSRDFMAQLASFSSVEQGVQTNAKLDRMLQASALSQADAILGRVLTSSDGTVTGTVQAVQLSNDGLIAILDTGEELVVGAGVKFS